jgi:hypothetical protein
MAPTVVIPVLPPLAEVLESPLPPHPSITAVAIPARVKFLKLLIFIFLSPALFNIWDIFPIF